MRLPLVLAEGMADPTISWTDRHYVVVCSYVAKTPRSKAEAIPGIANGEWPSRLENGC